MTYEVPSDSPYLSTDLNLGQLPAFLERAMLVADDPAQQDMLLVSALTACSYALPHMKMLHGGITQHTYYPNLFSLIIAPPATGKGVMNNARLLISPIHDYLKTKGGRAFIPANSSHAAFADLLDRTGGNGFVIETEMDILSKIWKKDFGDYSDLFRQAFEHEMYTKARRTSGRKSDVSDIEIPLPRLSVLLSGTPNQVKPLIGTGEDGLASRFLPYLVYEVPDFDRNVLLHGDHYQENAAQKVFSDLGKELLARYQWLEQQDHDCLWSLTDEQAHEFGDFLDDAFHLAMMDKIDHETGEPLAPLPESFRSAFNRLVVTIKRIGLILTALRLPLPVSQSPSLPQGAADRMNPRGSVPPAPEARGGGAPFGTAASDGLHSVGNLPESHSVTNLPSVLYCSDDDFRTLILFAEKFLRHTVELYLMLPDEKSPLATTRRANSADTSAEQLLDYLPKRFTTAEANMFGEERDLSRQTIHSYLQRLIDLKRIKKVKQGHYKKI